MRRHIVRLMVAALAAFLGLATTALPALAHPIRTYGTLYKTMDLCTKGRISMDHSSSAPGGWIDTTTYSETRTYVGGTWVACGTPWLRPSTNIRTSMNMWQWSGSGSTWYLCDPLGWIYNTAQVARLTLSKQYADPPCGENYYLAQGFMEVRNSSWYGGSYYTDDYHYYPTYSPARTAPPPLPDFKNMPDKVKMVGRDGKVITDGAGNPVLVDWRSPRDMDTTGLERRIEKDEQGVLEERVILR